MANPSWPPQLCTNDVCCLDDDLFRFCRFLKTRAQVLAAHSQGGVSQPLRGTVFPKAGLLHYLHPAALVLVWAEHQFSLFIVTLVFVP